MNDEEAEALGLRYLAAGGIDRNAKPGGWTVKVPGGVRDERGRLWRGLTGSWPDFRDQATLGCLEGEVEERCEGAVVMMRGNGWFSVETDHGAWDQGNTPNYPDALVRALNLVRALEAAP